MYPTMANRHDISRPGQAAHEGARHVLTVERAAALLGCHVNTVRNLIRTGKLKAFRVGRAIRIRRDVLIDFTESK